MNKIFTHLVGLVVLFSLFAWIGIARADNTDSSEVKAQTASAVSTALSSVDAITVADLMTANMPSPYTAQRVN